MFTRISIKLRFERVRITFEPVRTYAFYTRISTKMRFELVRITFDLVRSCAFYTRISIKMRFEPIRITFELVRTSKCCNRMWKIHGLRPSEISNASTILEKLSSRCCVIFVCFHGWSQLTGLRSLILFWQGNYLLQPFFSFFALPRDESCFPKLLMHLILR